MQPEEHQTRLRLVVAAADLFRLQGYAGTGLSEILAAAKAPKGSLYHHFPKGKSDLAIAAADWASDGMLKIIEDSFIPADSFTHGATTLCYKLAKFFDISDGWMGCPVSHTLFDGPANDVFRAKADAIFDAWIAALARHALRLGRATDEGNARAQAETLLIALQGAWVLARSRKVSDVLRHLPKMMNF